MIRPQLPSGAKAWSGVVLAAAAITLTIRALTPDYARVRAGRADAGYLESGDCRKCHAMNYASRMVHSATVRNAEGLGAYFIESKFP